MSRVLSVLSGQSGALRQQPRTALPVLREALHYVVGYQDRWHHPREELMYARLAARDPRLRLPLERLRRDHRQSLRAGTRLRDALGRITEAASPRRFAALARTIDHFADATREHIAREEQLMYSKAASVLRSEDWSTLKRDSPPPAPMMRALAGRGSPYPALAAHFASPARQVLSKPDSFFDDLVFEPMVVAGGLAVERAFTAKSLVARQAFEVVGLGGEMLGLMSVPSSLPQWWQRLLDAMERNSATVARWGREWREVLVARRDEQAAPGAEPVRARQQRRR